MCCQGIFKYAQFSATQSNDKLPGKNLQERMTGDVINNQVGALNKPVILLQSERYFDKRYKFL